jgi:hypothetical protein
MPSAAKIRLAGLARLALAAWLAACAGCRLPAIDPTGRHIFSGESTSLAFDHFHDGPLFGHKHGQPAPAAPGCAPTEVGPLVPAGPPIVAVPAAPPVPIVPVGCGPEQRIQALKLPGCK